ncbi:MAG: 16S rRNA (cytidine(1402)-2'-O)-methyltransferase [Desulfobacterales bacterium]
MHLNSPTGNPKNTPDSGTLYVVATPIGNMNDITVRALDILGHVDLIAAEDTRHTGKLLKHHHIKGRLMSYHEHNENERTPLLIEKIKAGSSIALISNAGTPSVSDPGYMLVQRALENRITIVPIPGASAVITALSISGLPTDSFIFIGFCAKRKTRRLRQLQELAGEKRTLIFYENPGRILAFMIEIKDMMGDRYGVLCREMTKLHEEFLRGRLSELIETLSRRRTVKGECTLLVKGCEENIKVPQRILKAQSVKYLIMNIIRNPKPETRNLIIYPVILAVPDEKQLLTGREKVSFLSTHARRALEISAQKSRIQLGVLNKNKNGVPLPFNGNYWSVTHKTGYVGGVVAPTRIGIDLEKMRPIKSPLYGKTARNSEWALSDTDSIPPGSLELPDKANY